MEIDKRVIRWPLSNKSEADDPWRKSCGCIKTSDKLRRIIDGFPSTSPPPPTPLYNNPRPVGVTQPNYPLTLSDNDKLSDQSETGFPVKKEVKEVEEKSGIRSYLPIGSFMYEWMSGLFSLVQLCLTATALGLYYMLYCYMQLVYFTLKSALFFHQADGPMKVTIAILTLTSLFIGLNVVIKIEKLLGIYY